MRLLPLPIRQIFFGSLAAEAVPRAVSKLRSRGSSTPLRNHAKYNPSLSEGVWPVPYTPYSYLINEITSDLESLTEKAIKISVVINKGPSQDSAPSMTGKALVEAWCLSVWKLMSEPNHMSPEHVDRIAGRYFWCMFALGWQTTQVLYNAGQSVPRLNAWRDFFLKELEVWLKHPKQEHFTALHRVFNNLGGEGKPFISDGLAWLQTKLHPNFFP